LLKTQPTNIKIFNLSKQIILIYSIEKQSNEHIAYNTFITFHRNENSLKHHISFELKRIFNIMIDKFKL